MIPQNTLRACLLGLASVTLLASPKTIHAQQSAPANVTAIETAADQDWDLAYALAQPADAVTRDLITWMRLRDGDGVFADYIAFARARPEWPGLDRLRARAAETITPDTAADQIIAWFQDAPPTTGEGAVALARALIAEGDTDKAHAAVIAVWQDNRLTDSGHDALLDGFADVLAPYHAARTDGLLWRWRTTDADRMLALLDDDQAALARARIAYIRKQSDLDDRLAAVPDALRDDAGLAYDRFSWLSDTGERTQAIALLKARSTSAQALGDPFRWSGWRRSLARWEMRQGRYDSAYQLAAKHHLTEGTSFADLEWIAGYVALRHLNQADVALGHFQTALGAVDSPISLGRMHYWIARSHAALGDTDLAQAAYALSAEHQTSFYGLLSAQQLGLSLDPALTGRDDPSDWQGADVMANDLTRAALTLLEAGERGRAVLFFAQLGKILNADDLARLGAYLRTQNEAYFAVLLGKTAVRRGVLVPSIYFPLHDMENMDLPTPKALALSIARRESEFNAGVGSPVGALGLMQLMPATAQEVAGFIGEPYSRARLTSDWAYNARLGSKYLSVLQDEFGYSPVMIAAGYNAGPSRPKRWMDERGDPRIGEADVVDWIEHIPFRETRNYVMRVTESLPVYQARLTGRTGPIRFTDILNGVKPVVYPVARPDDLVATFEAARKAAEEAATAAALEAAIAVPSAPAGPQPVTGVRPISRPGN